MSLTVLNFKIVQYIFIEHAFYTKYYIDYMIIFSVIFLVLSLFDNFILNSRIEYLKSKAFTFEITIILISILSIPIIFDNIGTNSEFSIGIYKSNSSEPLNFSGEHIKNPVLTSRDITDIPARFVADPFLFHYGKEYFLFFEVGNMESSDGNIGLATSNNGYNWSYKQIVLAEPFHLSYPYVFEWKNKFYMIPESNEAQGVRLYQASDFPYNWSFVKTLIEGKSFCDSSICYYNNTWWLFTSTPSNSDLFLYYSDSLFGPWIEHPKSPIIKGDMNISRPAGNIVVLKDRIIRYAQDDYPSYGNNVRIFEITNISKNTYEEDEITNIPVLKERENWNLGSMHQISPCKVNNKTWIAAIDGCQEVPS